MDKHTYGGEPADECLAEILADDPKIRGRVKHFLEKYDAHLNVVWRVTVKKDRDYLVGLVCNDYMIRADERWYTHVCLSFVQNHIKRKARAMRRSKTDFTKPPFVYRGV